MKPYVFYLLDTSRSDMHTESNRYMKISSEQNSAVYSNTDDNKKDTSTKDIISGHDPGIRTLI